MTFFFVILNSTVSLNLFQGPEQMKMRLRKSAEMPDQDRHDILERF